MYITYQVKWTRYDSNGMKKKSRERTKTQETKIEEKGRRKENEKK